MAEAKNTLLRALTLKDAIALLVGTVIGTGVFLDKNRRRIKPGYPTPAKSHRPHRDER